MDNFSFRRRHPSSLSMSLLFSTYAFSKIFDKVRHASVLEAKGALISEKHFSHVGATSAPL